MIPEVNFNIGDILFSKPCGLTMWLESIYCSNVHVISSWAVIVRFFTVDIEKDRDRQSLHNG